MGVVQVGFYLINLVVDDSYTWGHKYRIGCQMSSWGSIV